MTYTILEVTYRSHVSSRLGLIAVKYPDPSLSLFVSVCKKSKSRPPWYGMIAVTTTQRWHISTRRFNDPFPSTDISVITQTVHLSLILVRNRRGQRLFPGLIFISFVIDNKVVEAEKSPRNGVAKTWRNYTAVKRIVRVKRSSIKNDAWHYTPRVGRKQQMVLDMKNDKYDKVTSVTSL